MKTNYYPKKASWGVVNATSMNISHYIFRDLERTGNYDLSSKPMMKIAVELTKPDGSSIVKRSNIQGFVNFTNSISSSPVDVSESGSYQAEVMVPQGWEVTTGNAIQKLEFRENSTARAGIVVDSIPEPVGLAQILTIEGRIEYKGVSIGDEDILLTVISPLGVEKQITTTNRFFKFKSQRGKWKLMVQLKGTDIGYEQTIVVKNAPIKLSTILLGEKPKNSNKLVVQTVGFENIISTGIRKMPNGVANLNWKNLIIAHHEYYNGEGYVNGLMSGKYVAYNTSGYPVTIHQENGFDFYGGYFSSAFLRSAEGETLVVRAWRGEQLVATEEFELSSLGPFWLEANFFDISKLELATKHYWQFVVDDIVVGT